MFCAESAVAVDGTVAYWHDGKPVAVKRTLQTSPDALLQSALVSIKNVPATLLPDPQGCLCYSVEQKEFAFAHAFYYATLQLQEVNAALGDLGLPSVSGITISLGQYDSPTQAPAGGTDFDGRTINLGYPHPAFDVSILAHEIGHAVHLQLLKTPLPELLPVMRQDPMTLSFADARTITFQMGIVEGAAQMGAVLFTGDSRIGRYDWVDMAYEMDNFVRFPDLVPSYGQHYTGWATAPIFSKTYPDSASLARDLLINKFGVPYHQEWLAWPEPYSASAAIIQPMFRAMQRFGKGAVLRTHLKALATMTKWSGYRDWAEALIQSADSPELRSFLNDAFSERGLFDSSANP